MSQPSRVAAELTAAAATGASAAGEHLAPFTAAAFGGVLYFLGYLGWGVWPCMFVFLIPLWWALDRVAEQRIWRALATGFTFGLAAYAGGFLWLWHLADTFLAGNRWFAGLLWVAYGALFASAFALYGALYRGMRRRRWSQAVAGIAPLLVVEWLQPQVFPLYAGNALVGAPVWIQTADLGGPLLLTALLAVVNLVACETWTWWRSERTAPRTVWAAAAALAATVFAYGHWRIAMVEAATRAAPALRIGIVQANLGPLEKSALGVVTHRRHLELTRELLATGALDLVVWPESAYLRGLRGPLPISGRPIVADLDVALIFGGNSVREENGRRRKTNSAFLVAPDATIHDVYDKNLLIPLAEHMPLIDVVPALARWFPHVEEFAAATDTPPLHLGSWRIATPICYEATRPDFVRRMVAASRPHLLVTLANDAWFGDSHEPWLHLALARLRAVEHRRFMIRATNSGVSAVIDPAGRVVARTGLLTTATLRADVHPLDGATVYGRVGDWPGWLSAAIVGFALMRSRPGGARDARRSQVHGTVRVRS